ncbi:MAG: hypothetical protein R3F34_18260 [Planctomycetota bacterium]
MRPDQELRIIATGAPPSLVRAFTACVFAACVAGAARSQDGGDLDRAYDALLGPRTDAAPTDAPTDPLDVALEPEPSDWHFDLAIGFQQISRAGLDQGPGDVERRGTIVGLTAHSGADEDDWRFTYRFESRTYRFDGASGLLPGTSEPIESTYRHRFGTARGFDLSKRLSARFDAEVDLGSEVAFEVSDALTWIAILGASWRIDDTFSLSLDVRAQDRLEDDVAFVPVPGFDWRIDDRTRLRVDATGLELTRDLERGARAYVSTRYQDVEIRLDDTGPNPGGSFAERGFLTRAGILFDPGVGGHSVSSSTLDLFVGVAHAREIEFRAGGVEVGGDDVDPSAYFGLELTLRF